MINEVFEVISFFVFIKWMCSSFLGIGYCKLLMFMFFVNGIVILLGRIILVVMMLLMICCRVLFSLGIFSIFSIFVKLKVMFGFLRKNIVILLMIGGKENKGFKMI